VNDHISRSKVPSGRLHRRLDVPRVIVREGFLSRKIPKSGLSKAYAEESWPPRTMGKRARQRAFHLGKPHHDEGL
jgi:hypothetical protein